jgi:RND superfamily putative drug exporter
VIVSGSTVAIGLLSLVILPIPVIRSIGIGGMLIPAVSVVSGITLVPAMLSILGPRINSVRVMPKNVVHATDAETGFWWRWARFVTKRPLPVFLAGLAIVALLLIPALHLNPSESQAKDLPGRGDAIDGRSALVSAGISLGVLKPFVVLVEHGAAPGPIAEKVAAVEGVNGALAPAGPGWRRGGSSLVEAFPSTDGSAKATRGAIRNVPRALAGTSATLGGVAPEERDFVHAVYGNFPYMLAFVILLTFILLMRAFRSLLLPLKAVILNLVSLGAAYGVIVFIFQDGHGSNAIWGVHATNAIISWIPLMIFAFLYGLSMDYEVFMLTRMREAYDETGDTQHAIQLGLARTGKLVTSAALILMFAFIVLSSSPGVDIKQFGIGLAAGIIFDATIIRALLVPSLMRLMGSWNWWLPHPVARVLLIRRSEPAAENA